MSERRFNLIIALPILYALSGGVWILFHELGLLSPVAYAVLEVYYTPLVWLIRYFE